MAKGYLSKEQIKEITEEYLNKANIKGTVKNNYFCHLNRYLITLQYLRDMNFKGNVLEIGGYDAISEVIRREFPDNNYYNTSVDLRNERFLSPDNTYDFILNLEVLEHIAEADEYKKQVFNNNGAKHFLFECYRVLKPGGQMLLTTPNSNSYFVFLKMLELRAPWVFESHYKEYTVYQVIEMLSNINFKTISITTETVFNNDLNKILKIESFLKANNYPLANRGDIIFVRCTK